MSAGLFRFTATVLGYSTKRLLHTKPNFCIIKAQGGEAMDHQKTGTLIATRRNELGLTQKELAKQLNISDRTISKWERSAGFPDISLLEPLADALGLTLLELFRGERTPEPELQAEIEQTTRETVQKLKPEFKKTLKHLRLWRRLLICAMVVLIILFLHPDSGYVYFTEDISAAKAVQTCPFVLITTQEYDMIRQICADPDIAPLFVEGTLLDLDSTIADRYRSFAQIDGLPAERFTISILGESFIVDCWAGNARYMLSVVPKENLVRKTAAEYRHFESYSTSHNLRYCLENENNVTFTKMDRKLDLRAPFRSS